MIPFAAEVAFVSAYRMRFFNDKLGYRFCFCPAFFFQEFSNGSYDFFQLIEVFAYGYL